MYVTCEHIVFTSFTLKSLGEKASFNYYDIVSQSSFKLFATQDHPKKDYESDEQ